MPFCSLGAVTLLPRVAEQLVQTSKKPLTDDALVAHFCFIFNWIEIDLLNLIE